MDSARFDTIAARFGQASSRRTTVKMLGGLGALMLGLGIVSGASAANPQHNFVADCRVNEGTLSVVQSRVLRCTYDDSGYVEGNFLTVPPTYETGQVYAASSR